MTLFADNQSNLRKSGFTLVEVMVSMAIMIIIGGIIISSQVQFNRATTFDEVVTDIVLTIRDQQYRAVNAAPTDPNDPSSFYNGRGFSLQNFSAAPRENNESLVFFYDDDGAGDADNLELANSEFEFSFKDTSYDITRIYVKGSGILDGQDCYIEESSDDGIEFFFIYLRPFSDPIMRIKLANDLVARSNRTDIRTEGRRLSKVVLEITDIDNDYIKYIVIDATGTVNTFNNYNFGNTTCPA